MSASLSTAGEGFGESPHGPGDRHIVQFYEDEGFLVERVASFLLRGIHERRPLVVIATSAHRAAFRERLVVGGIDVERLEAEGGLTMLDASETLDKFMVGERPDARLYRAVVGAVLATAAEKSAGGEFFAYGEMVDLLWRAGKREAAVALEELWNDIGKDYPFSLLCAYVMDNFNTERDAAGFAEVCRTHSRVVPTERYLGLQDSDTRLREVSALQQRARALESEVAHRKQIEEELREAVRVRDDFLCVAGHELRTPLTVLRLQVASLLANERATQTARVETRLAKVVAQTERVARLAERLIDASQIGDGMALQPEPLDLVALARDTADTLTDVATAARCRVGVLGDSSVIGSWDRDRLEQVLQELLSNAFKFGRGTDVQVLVKGLPAHAEVVVRDGGPGIPDGEEDRIFDRFIRAAPTESFGGLGLGLWIARRIVDAHAGEIGVDKNSDREGATFFVRLPYSAVKRG